ncbi:chromate efflux transporter [Thermodesulfovibrio hydrogeniphilus]
MILQLFLSFLKLGLTAFGGPAMVAYIKELAVDKKGWLDKKTFQEGVALAQAIPGATAVQVAGYVGLKKAGILGGLASFSAFALPAFILMLILSALYAKTHSTQEAIAIFTGLQVIVVAIVANAFISFTRPIIKSKGEIFIAFLAFVLFLIKINPFLIIVVCAFVSQIIFKDKSTELSNETKPFALKGLTFLFVLVILGLIILYFLDKTLFNLSITMMKIDLFAFGGGYASLPLMLHEFVERLDWIDGKTFMDGIALGQVTPGPIVITATFVGYLMKGFVGATVATVSVFAPSFLILSLATELSEKIKHSKLFLRAKKGLLASFSGLLLFALFKFIQSVDWSLIKIAIAVVCFIALYGKINILYVVTVGSLLSFLIFR